MRASARVLVCMAFGSHGVRAHTSSEHEVTLGYHSLVGSQQSESRRQLRLPFARHGSFGPKLSQSGGRVGVPHTWKALSMLLLLAFKNPTSGWQVRSYCRGRAAVFSRYNGICRTRTLQRRLRPLVSAPRAVVARCRTPGASAEDYRPSQPDMEVRWLELDTTLADSEPRDGATTMPVFPMQATYLPYTSQVLSIFEPRYRAMYNDILFSGARRFMVCQVDETHRLAEVGVIFYLDDLNEISEQTQDRLKYVGEHTVKGRVKLLKVLNPRAAVTRNTYLRAEVEEFADSDLDQDTTSAEQELRQLFFDLVDAQVNLGEEPRFTEAVRSVLDFTCGTGEDEKGLWGAVILWQQFLTQRTLTVREKMQNDIQSEISNFLKSNSLDSDRTSKREMRVEDLPEELSQKTRAIQRRYTEELQALEDPEGLQFQAILQSSSHAERLALLQYMLDQEMKRLAARASLQSMFSEGDDDLEA